ncbi:MAG: penicillin-binding protein 1A [Paracoccus sp. (in: a-proteobacteria)]|uniref:penicillin-binding protein 1A n=1 Tax=unclassified Paracoccus (in: a-proteobacteria) TaxID=2688777 RepID=UPI000C5E5C36|nr:MULTISPECIES: PBP1A family penicillin-binding protein [unclassified Paracoccus (in: a-proteobacteria)]MAN57545.1 penicillin-binding protein [Paracoccus sp. (in: a-proteobacteria)]MBA47397.1 penicillin-binding protein [Paracoccus sp. (in: a-proteobacteria)]
MLRAILSFFGAIFSWITTASFFAALTVGGIFWVYSRDLPSYETLAQYSPKTISRIYSGEGRLIDEFAEERRIFVPVEEIPVLVKEAFISAEDKNFYVHPGYDIRGIVGAAFEAARTGGRELRGASTITQQVMKNFLLSSDRSVERKVKELILASRLERSLSKDKILELYLNEIYLGQNSYGVAAAAQVYFNKSLTELAPHEAAMLAALPQAPGRYHPVRQKDRVTERRNYVLREMWQNGYLDEATYQAEARLPLKSVQNGDYPDFREQMPTRDYFTDEIRRQLSREFGYDEFFGGGLTIRATVDPNLQAAAAEALREALEQYDRGRGLWRGTGKTIPEDQLQDEATWRGALFATRVPRDIPGWRPAVVLEVGASDARIGIEGIEENQDGHWIVARDVQWARKLDGDSGRPGPRAQVAGDLVSVGDVVLVRPMVSDSDGSFLRWTLRQVPEIEGGFMAMDVNTGRVMAMQGGFSYQSSVFNRATQAMRQPGSSFKPFVYAAALDNNYTPATIVLDEPITLNTPEGLWEPKNAGGRNFGPSPMRTGIEQSRNLMTIRIAQDIGMDRVAEYAERFGAYDRLKPFLANALGAQETTLFRMVAAYAMFANGGERVEPTLVDRVQDRRGRTIYRHDRRVCETCSREVWPAGEGPVILSNRERVMDAVTAYQLTSMMQGVVKRGSGKGVNLPVPIAGKTGTTNDAKDVWFIGFSSNIVAGCYLGYDQPRTLGANAFGGTLCVPVFNAFMRQAIKEFGGTDFKVPPGGYWVKIDRFTGQRLPDSASGDNVIAEYFRDGTDPDWLSPVVISGFGDATPVLPWEAGSGSRGATSITTSTGKRKVIPRSTDFGTMSSGGLY